MIASIVLSRFNDAYYGQWLVLNLPFHDISDLWLPEVELVPKEYRHFALCLLHRPEHWRNQEVVRRELEIDAFKDNHIDNVLSMQLAYTSFIDKYLAGELHVDEDPIPQWNPYADDAAHAHDNHLLTNPRWKVCLPQITSDKQNTVSTTKAMITTPTLATSTVAMTGKV